MRKANVLTAQMKKLCDEFLLTNSITQSALKANYHNPSNADKTLQTSQCETYLKSKQKKLEQKVDITFDRQLKRINIIIKNILNEDKETLDIKHTKVLLDALAEQNKMLGYYAAEKRINLNIRTDPDLCEIVDMTRTLIETKSAEEISKNLLTHTPTVFENQSEENKKR